MGTSIRGHITWAHRSMGISFRGHIIPWAHHSVGTSFRGHIILSAHHSVGTSFRGHLITWAHHSVGTSLRGHIIPSAPHSVGTSFRGHMFHENTRLVPKGLSQRTMDALASSRKAIGLNYHRNFGERDTHQNKKTQKGSLRL